MAKQEKKDRILFYDPMKAHSAYGKRIFRSHRYFEFVFAGNQTIETKLDYLKSENISTIVFFVYGKNGIFELSPFLKKGVQIILCTSNSEISWIVRSHPEIILLDIDVPKKELFRQIEAGIFSVRRCKMKNTNN